MEKLLETNYSKTIYWLLTTIKWGSIIGFGGLCFGCIIAAISNHGNGEVFLAAAGAGVICGVITGGIIPATLFVWFLLLHMVGQLSSAVKNK